MIVMLNMWQLCDSMNMSQYVISWTCDSYVICGVRDSYAICWTCDSYLICWTCDCYVICKKCESYVICWTGDSDVLHWTCDHNVICWRCDGYVKLLQMWLFCIMLDMWQLCVMLTDMWQLCETLNRWQLCAMLEMWRLCGILRDVIVMCYVGHVKLCVMLTDMRQLCNLLDNGHSLTGSVRLRQRRIEVVEVKSVAVQNGNTPVLFTSTPEPHPVSGTLFCRSQLSGTWESTSTPTSPWRTTLPTPFVHASLRCGRFAVFVDLFLDTPCWPLIRALVVSKVDYCISALACITGHLMDKLQSVLNAAARLVFSAGKSEQITSLLRKLHWVRVPKRIQFRLCVLVHRCLHGSAPAYLAESLHWATEVSARHCLHGAASGIPCREPPLDHRSERPSFPAVSRQLVIDHPIHTVFDHRRLGFPCCSVQGLEQSAQLNEEHRVLAKFSPETQNIALLVVDWLNCYWQSLIFMLNNDLAVSHRCYRSALLMTL